MSSLAAAAAAVEVGPIDTATGDRRTLRWGPDDGGDFFLTGSLDVGF